MIAVVGLSHQNAPIEIREAAALNSEAVHEVLRALMSDPAISEAFCVSTCNRVEIICVGVPGDEAEELSSPRSADLLGDAAAALRAARAVLLERAPSASAYLFEKSGEEAVRHLMRVASSLDSLVVGEPQILGQLKEGFSHGLNAESVGPVLHRVFSKAIRTAKQVRSRTAIGGGQVSVPSIAVQLSRQIFDELERVQVVLVGSGEMGQSVARLLADQGAAIVVVGRNLEKLAPLCEELGAEARSMDALDEALLRADIVVSSTSATGVIFETARMREVVKKRRRRNLFMIDLAVPRDIEPSCSALDGIFLYNIDDLSQVAQDSFSTRKQAAMMAEELVDDAVSSFVRWSYAEQVTPVIKNLRALLRQGFNEEFERSLKLGLKTLSEEESEAVQRMIEAGINRVLHAPTTRLRSEAESAENERIFELASALDEVFSLSEAASFPQTPPVSRKASKK